MPPPIHPSSDSLASNYPLPTQAEPDLTDLQEQTIRYANLFHRLADPQKRYSHLQVEAYQHKGKLTQLKLTLLNEPKKENALARSYDQKIQCLFSQFIRIVPLLSKEYRHNAPANSAALNALAHVMLSGLDLNKCDSWSFKFDRKGSVESLLLQKLRKGKPCKSQQQFLPPPEETLERTHCIIN